MASSGPRTFDGTEFPIDQVLQAKETQGLRVSVCIPAHDEARTVGRVVETVAQSHLIHFGGSGLVDEVIVVDDRSSDSTAAEAERAGAAVLRATAGGKGEAMTVAAAEARGDVLVFLDADVEDTTERFVTNLAGPLILDSEIALVKGYYRRPLEGSPTGGGRVTELLAGPILDVCFPELAPIRQPLAGETAIRRLVLDKLTLAGGYGVELALLLDVADRFGPHAIAQVDLGIRTHRNRPLSELRPQAADVLRVALDRLIPGSHFPNAPEPDVPAPTAPDRTSH